MGLSGSHSPHKRLKKITEPEPTRPTPLIKPFDRLKTPAKKIMAASNKKSTTFMGSKSDIQKIFNKFDKNGDGKISSSEVMESLKELGTEVTAREVQCLMQEVDKDGDGHIDLDEFVDFIQSGGVDDGSPESEENELRDAFDLYDIDKNGLISANELYKVMNMLGLKCSLSECNKIIRRVDQDGDGSVNFQEFKLMMSEGLP